MNKQLSDAISRLSHPPEELTAEQIAEIERRLEADEIASDGEVEASSA